MRLTDEQIGAELSALRETPSETFAAELDAWAAEGFPTMKQLEPTRRRFEFARRRPVLTAAASGLALVAVVAVSVAAYLSASGVRTDSSGGPASATQDSSATLVAAPKQAFGTGAPAVSLASSGTRPRNARPQVQEQSGSPGLATDAAKLE